MPSQPTSSPYSASTPRLSQVVAGWLSFLLTLSLTLYPALADKGTVDDLPQAVIDSLEAVVPGLIFTEINIEEEDDGTEYEIHGIWGSREVEAKLDEFGEILDLDIGDEENDDDELPSEVEDTLEKALGDLSVGGIELIGRGELTFFEIRATVSDTATLIRITPTGALLWVETAGLELDLSEGTVTDEAGLPSAVVETVGEMEVETLLEFSVPDTMFLVEGRRGKSMISMVVTEAGDLLSFELDRDADGIGDILEATHGTDFSMWDTDGDNFPDGFELSENTDPLDATSSPKIVSINTNGAEGVFEIKVQTFRGADFLLEQCGDAAGDWEGLGACLVGDGLVHEFVVPLVEEIRRCFFRIKIIPLPEEGHRHGVDSSSISGEGCGLPERLVGTEIKVGDDGDESKSLCFKTGSRGEVVGREDGEIEVTPFAYTFEITGECEMRVTLTFSTSDGFETKVFTLTFTSESEGAYVSQGFENGEPEDPEEGGFRLTQN